MALLLNTIRKPSFFIIMRAYELNSSASIFIASKIFSYFNLIDKQKTKPEIARPYYIVFDYFMCENYGFIQFDEFQI